MSVKGIYEARKKSVAFELADEFLNKYTRMVVSTTLSLVFQRIVDDCAIMGDQAALDDFVFQVQKEGLLLGIPVRFDQVGEIAGIHLTGMEGHASGKVTQSDDEHAIDKDFFF